MTYAVQNGLREDGAALTLRGVVPRHKKGHIPAITKPADMELARFYLECERKKA